MEITNATLILRLNYYISRIDTKTDRSNDRHVKHLYALKQRLINGKKLTKKMEQNLSWIKEEITKDIETRKKYVGQ